MARTKKDQSQAAEKVAVEPQPKTQADFKAALEAGQYDFSGWEFTGDIVIEGDHTGKDFNFYQVKIKGDLLIAREATFRNLYAREATFNDLDAREATFNDLDAREATFRNLYAREATFRNLYAREATFNDLDAREATFNDLDAREATFNDLDARATAMKTYNFSGAKWAKRLTASQYLAERFERTDKGYIVYKTFGAFNMPNPAWVIEPNSVIEEIPNLLPTVECGAGINVAPLRWVEENNSRTTPIWKCLIEWDWLSDVVVPWMTDGKIRCGKLRLLEIVERD